LDQVGIHDNFFDLGGDSISAVRVTSAMQRLLDDAVMLVAVFEAPTVGELAAHLSAQHPQSVAARYRDVPHSTASAISESPLPGFEQGEI